MNATLSTPTLLPGAPQLKLEPLAPGAEPKSITMQLQRLARRDEPGTHLLQLGTLISDASERGLLLIIHPGDALEHPFGWAKGEYHEVREISLANQRAMAAEIEQLLPTHDCVILHSMSSVDLTPRAGHSWVDSAYTRAIERASELATILYGDDTAEVAEWISAHAGLERRQEVFLTGAYSCAAAGCVTDICERVLVAHPHLHAAVSAHSPTNSTNSMPRWQPPEPQDSADEQRAHERMRA